MRAYSMDLRERVLADCDAGVTTRAVAQKYRVSESWVRRLKPRRAATGETAPRPPGTAGSASATGTPTGSARPWPRTPTAPGPRCATTWACGSAWRPCGRR